MKEKLRIGILIDDYLISAWVFKMLENIISSEHSEIVLSVKKKEIRSHNIDMNYMNWVRLIFLGKLI